MKNRFEMLLILLILLLPAIGCSKYSTQDYLDLEYRYHELEKQYEYLKEDYENLEDEFCDYMTNEDLQALSDFANLNKFGYKGFYSTAYCVVLRTGGTTKIHIGYDGYGSIYYEADNYHATANWGDWDDNNRAALTINGTSPGITYLTITNDEDSRRFRIVVFVVE